MSEFSPADEAELLIDHLEARGLTELQAVAVMGHTINCLLVDDEIKREFLHQLAAVFFPTTETPQ